MTEGIITTFALRIFTADAALVARVTQAAEGGNASPAEVLTVTEAVAAVKVEKPAKAEKPAKKDKPAKEDPALPTEADVRKKLRSYSRRKGVGVAGVTEVLVKMKVERFDELTRQQYPELLELIA